VRSPQLHRRPRDRAMPLPTFERVAPAGFTLEPSEERGGEEGRDSHEDSKPRLDARSVGGVSAVGCVSAFVGVLVSVSPISGSRRSVGVRRRGRARRRGPLRFAQPPAPCQGRRWSTLKSGESGSRASCTVGAAPLAALRSSRHHPIRIFRASSSEPLDQGQLIGAGCSEPVRPLDVGRAKLAPVPSAGRLCRAGRWGRSGSARIAPVRLRALGRAVRSAVASSCGAALNLSCGASCTSPSR
jgi:hypothetical protein